MNCPWCGSPVMIRGSSWECGWCGDFGSLQRTPAKKSPNTAQITLTLSFVYHVNLPETWNDLKKALGQLAPKNILLSQLLGKVLLHNISAGIQNARALPDEKKAEELRTFLHNTLDLNLGESADEIMRDAKRGVLFREEAALSETNCGTFWTELLATRPVEDYYNRVDPDGLFELFSELSSAYAYFGGKKDEEMGEAQDYQNALEEAFNTHWQNKVLLHPDVERAKRLLAQGKFPDYEDICREILLVEYPEEVPHETAEDFDELSWERVLDDVFADDPEKGMEMLSEQELDTFLQAVQNDDVWRDFFYTELMTGLRRGEICALMWRDFDAKAGTLGISRTLHSKGQGIYALGDTKTSQGNRTIILAESVAALLRARKKASISQWIFPQPTSPELPMNPGTAYRRLKTLLEEAGLPSIRFHDLRHTFATHALTSGVDAKTLAGILGHTNASFTLDTYTHVTPDMREAAGGIVGGFMEDLFGKELKPWQRSEKQATD